MLDCGVRVLDKVVYEKCFTDFRCSVALQFGWTF
ncbi:hypothetical protein ANAPRD1_00329 [Anaplasma phagocytophilum]|nr:hypothetical protein ANAPH2_00440 [Anaplasma phagocytophilum]SCV63036.1 hypothetical protein ANAPRD1_00329 [Anaplasma phagocytophilum]